MKFYAIILPVVYVYTEGNYMSNFERQIDIIANFDIDGEVVSIDVCGDGHINSTFLAITDKGTKYLLQKINTGVFPKPLDVMDNIVHVTEFLKEKGQETLNVIKTRDGNLVIWDGEECYRVYDFIENTVTYQLADEEIFRNAGAAFGEFQKTLSDFDASELHEIIANFHNTPVRYKNFCASVEKNRSGRLAECGEEVNFVKERENTYGDIVKGIEDGGIPLRVTHNDTKLNNILMDAATKKARAVIDLDTVMPGSMLYDFGDAIRFGASTAAEDEKDLEKVHFDINMFRAYAEGFCGALKDAITEKEAQLLPYSAYLMTMECGMRFLGDFIDGDTYFSTKYPEHNLDRCRTQFKLASEMEQCFDEMKKIIDECVNK